MQAAVSEIIQHLNSIRDEKTINLIDLNEADNDDMDDIHFDENHLNKELLYG